MNVNGHNLEDIIENIYSEKNLKKLDFIIIGAQKGWDNHFGEYVTTIS